MVPKWPNRFAGKGPYKEHVSAFCLGIAGPFPYVFRGKGADTRPLWKRSPGEVRNPKPAWASQ